MRKTAEQPHLERVAGQHCRNRSLYWLLAARHPRIPENLLVTVYTNARNSDPRNYLVRRTLDAATANPNLPRPLLDAEINLLIDATEPGRNTDYYAAALTNPNLTGDDLDDILHRINSTGEHTYSPSDRHNNATYLVAVTLDHPNTHPSTLAAWHQRAPHLHHRILQSIAANPNTDPTIQTELAGHRYASIRKAVANNPNLAPDALTLLIPDRTAGVRTILIRAGHLDADTLAASVTHDSPWVRSALARTSDNPETLHQLAYDQRRHVRNGVVANRNAPEEALVAIALQAG